MIDAELARQDHNRQAGIVGIAGPVTANISMPKLFGAIVIANLITAIIAGRSPGCSPAGDTAAPRHRRG